MKIKLLSVFAFVLMFVAPLFGEEQAAEPAAAGGPRVLRLINDFAAPPFSFREGGQPTGFEADLGEALGKKLGAKVKWIQMNFELPAYASALDKNQADAALASITITAKRKQQLSFTRPYFRTTLAIATRKINKESLTLQLSKRKFEGTALGVMEGTTGEDWARKNLKSTLKAYGSPLAMSQALQKDEVAAILIDEDILRYILSSQPYTFEVISRDLQNEDYGIAVRKDNRQLLSELNAALEKLDAEGVYDQIYEKWFTRPRTLPPSKYL